jgi:phosphatidylserine/phosphatidylglycerophosphate/cardiolipin synthase-like enzyme
MAQRLAAEMPPAMAEALANAIGRADVSARRDILHGVLQPHYRALASDLLDAWQKAQDLTPQAVSLILHTAAVSEKEHRERQTVELVWTGPDTQVVPLRQTEQAILQVLDSAQERITLVSYAVHRIPNVCGALVRSARRGVRISVIVETPDKLEGENEYSTLRALGDDVAACSAVYYWPKDQRGRDDNGKLGILHVKCAVADGRWLFLSSANLTEYAFTINMELGVLVTGGSLPGQVQEHFDRLIANNLLCRV